jgi:hypothetical protein
MWRPWVLYVAILAVAGCKSPGTATDPFFGRTRVEPPRTGTISGQPPGSSLSQTPVPGALTPGATQSQTPSSPFSGVAPANTIPPSQASGIQPNWTPAQPKVNSVPAAIPPQTSSGYRPPDGGFGFPGGANASSPGTPAGAGDRLGIPVAARAMGTPASDWATRRDTDTAFGATTAGAIRPGVGGAAGVGVQTQGPTSTASTAQPGTNPYLDNTSAAILAGRERIVRVIEPTVGTPSTAPRVSPYPSGSSGGSGGGLQRSPASDKPVNIADLPDAGS